MPTFRITGTGDSILGLAHTRWGAQSPYTCIKVGGRCLDLEWGRQPYRPGLAGRWSTYQAALAAIARSEPDGWIVLQDNGYDTTITDDSWAWMWRLIVAQTPTDRGIWAVTPAWRPDRPDWLTGTLSAAFLAERRRRMIDEIMCFNGRRQFLHMADIIPDYPDDFLDGQHPYTPEAQFEIMRHLPA